jgi:hypothetical protein
MRLVSMSLVVLAVACSGATVPGADSEDAALSDSPASVRATNEGASKKAAAPVNVVDHGGPVLASSNTYAIYWGDQSAFPSDLQSGMASLFSGFNGSAYLGIAGQYMRGASISSSYGGTFIDTSAPPSRAPRTSEIGAEVCKLIAHPDPSAIYFVFTSNAPKSNYCAWHDKATCNGVTFQVAYVPNQGLIPGCSPYTRSNLGCNSLSDGTVTSADSVAHEFMEAVTDPHIDAWYGSGGEIADKCNFNYQACVTLANGSTWQIQSEWSNAISGCAQ